MSALQREVDRRKLSDTISSINTDIVVRTDTRSSITTFSLPSRQTTTTEAEASIDVLSTRITRRFTESWARKRIGTSSSSHPKDAPRDELLARGPLGLRLVHSSPEPLVDLIFVHGLRGGSIRTWRKGDDPRSFWPQCWLPLEPGFEYVNIHTFGYDSDWASSKPSILNVHDFGQSLLEEMRNSPCLREDRERPIILIGHSMGGLVIKKAFILARDIPSFQDRIRTIFFLATPHRGSDYAAVLNRILTVSGIMSSRHYITDLTTGSTSIQLINDEFGKCAHDLPIFSFYEACKTNIGVSSAYIVEKHSAVLGTGYRNERVQYINANHREVCKFDSIDDANYLTIKNALGSAIQDLLKDISIVKREEAKEQLRVLRSYLGITDGSDEHHQKVEGSCQWIDSREDYQDWRDGADSGYDHQQMVPASPATPVVGASDNRSKNLSIFWVHANPGTGKTVLASHVVSQLQGFQLECASFYFHVGKKSSTSLAVFLRSIAFQMASMNASVRETLIRLHEEGSVFDMDDSRTIWTKVFKKGVLSARVWTPQYWVIDAVDECSRYQELFTMLRGERPNFPLRIFLTSRNIHDMQRLQRSLEPSGSVICTEIPIQSSLDDIWCYIQSRVENLPIDDINERNDLAKNILRKSNACFLWVRLVLDELENVYSSESIVKVLDSIPQGMVPYYERTINTMAVNSLEKHIAKALLVWTVASSRKLTLPELSQALKLDIDTILPSARSAVEGLCGQLVAVDKDSAHVDLIHPTVREFLLSDASGEFMVSGATAHERLALTCLKLLSGSELRPPRNPRFLSQSRPDPSPFLDYAMTHFTEHICAASSSSDQLLLAMDKFLKTNVLSWIERVARKGDLHCLIRASKNLKAYLDRRAKYLSPLNSQVRNVDCWSTDLSRLVTHFGNALLHNPSSIHFLLPPLCPSGSAIYQQFGKRPDGLAVAGSQQTAWDDCIAHVGFGDDIAAAVACGEHLIAVGMESGCVHLYNHRSCQLELVISNKHPVDLVHLTDDFIVMCTTRAIILKDLQGDTIWQNRLRFRCLLLTSSNEYIMAVSQHGHLLKWDKADGALLEDQEFEFRNFEADSSEVKHNGLSARAPHLASISADAEMLAIAYRGGSICLWDINAAEFVGWAQDEESRAVNKLLFNPNPNINVLLAIYTDHTLALFDTWSGSQLLEYHMPANIGVLSASCTVDGRTLATADSRGNMHIWDFESLSVLYHVHSPFPSFRLLNFTSDGSSIVDVVDSGMRVWSPAALVRKNLMDEDASISDDAIQLAVTEGEYEERRNAEITALLPHPSQPIVFAGRFDGEIVAFDAKTGTKGILYSHPEGAFITGLAVGVPYPVNKGVATYVASSDVNGSVQIWKLTTVSLLKPDSLTANIHTTGQMKQLCFSANSDFLLISTTVSDAVYRVSDGSCVGVLESEAHKREAWRWLAVPSPLCSTKGGKPGDDGSAQDQLFAFICDGTLKAFSAESFPLSMGVGTFPQLRLDYVRPDWTTMPEIQNAIIETSTMNLVLEVRRDSLFVSTSHTFIFDLSKVWGPKQQPEQESQSEILLRPSTQSTFLHAHIKHLIGLVTQKPTTNIASAAGNSRRPIMGTPRGSSSSTIPSSAQAATTAGASLLFIDQHSWLSSVKLEPRLPRAPPNESSCTICTSNNHRSAHHSAYGSYTQHFFIPGDYLSASGGTNSGGGTSGRGPVLPVQTQSGGAEGAAVVFCVNGEMVAVRNGMKFGNVREIGQKVKE